MRLWNDSGLVSNFRPELVSKEWFAGKLHDLFYDRDFCKSVCVLWEIWCARHRACFDLAVPSLVHLIIVVLIWCIVSPC